MNPEDDLPADEEELIEFVRNLIKKLTDNQDSLDLPIPIAELQRQLDKVIKAKQAKDVAKRKEQAAWEQFCLEQQKLREEGRKHGISESRINMLFSGKVKIANRIFSQLPDQGPVLYIPQKDKG